MTRLCRLLGLVILLLCAAALSTQSLSASEWFDAAKAGDAKKLEALLTADPKHLEETDVDGNTALLLAAKAGSLEAIKYLIDHKAALNARNHVNESALWLAADKDSTPLAQALIDAGAKVNTMALCGSTPLHCAVTRNNLAITKALLEHGAEPDLPSHATVAATETWNPPSLIAETPVQIAVSHGKLDMLKLLADHQAALDHPLTTQFDKTLVTGVTLLHLAARAGSKELVEYLLPQSNINAATSSGDTPLHFAAAAGSAEICRLLLDRKADVNALNKHGENAATLALDATQNQVELTALFEKYHSKGDGGRTAVQLLKSLATAQAQFIKKTDAYAISGKVLNSTGTLIAADFAASFESWQKNGDSAKPAPKSGYVFRMFLGDDAANLTSFLKDPERPEIGMNTWGCIARPVNGDGFQYYITEAGTVYRQKDPGTGKFLLDWQLPQDQTEWETAK